MPLELSVDVRRQLTLDEIREEADEVVTALCVRH
jgi:hypothetical protein